MSGRRRKGGICYAGCVHTMLVSLTAESWVEVATVATGRGRWVLWEVGIALESANVF